MPCSFAAKQETYNTSQSREHVNQPEEREKRRIKQQTIMAELVVSVFQRDSLVDNANQQTVSGKHQKVICEVQSVRCKPEK